MKKFKKDTRLNNCKKCGSDLVQIYNWTLYDKKGIKTSDWNIMCKKCLKLVHGFESEESAIKGWNEG
jgi:hypothetical protein